MGEGLISKISECIKYFSTFYSYSFPIKFYSKGLLFSSFTFLQFFWGNCNHLKIESTFTNTYTLRSATVSSNFMTP
jgi:hypothetical protein